MEEITANQEAVIIAKDYGIMLNNVEPLAKIMSIKRLKTLINDLNELLKYDNVFDIICNIIYIKLERACKRSKAEYNVFMDVMDEGGNNIVYFYIEEKKSD